MSDLNPGPRLAYTVDEACRQLGCKRTTLYLAISRRELDARKLGSRTIITGASLAQYIANRPKAEIRCKTKSRLGDDSGDLSGFSPQAIENSDIAAEARSANGRSKADSGRKAI